MQPTVATDLEVCNLALDILKEGQITSLDEDRSAARWMKRNYPIMRNMVMTTHIWKFAMFRAKLDEDAEPPDFEWAHRFRKPADCLRVLPLRVGGRIDGYLIPHQVEGDYILTNAPAPLYVRYLRCVTNPAEFPPLFVDALAGKLAERIAHKLTGKMSMVELGAAQYKEALMLAASIDSAEGSHAQQYATAYDEARYYAPAADY
jgi:hypothetical protein